MSYELPEGVFRRMDGFFYVDSQAGGNIRLNCEGVLDNMEACDSVATFYNDIEDAFYCYYCAEDREEDD